MLKKLLGIKQKANVILDTNILLLPGRQGFDIFTALTHAINEPFEMCIVSKTFLELKRIIEGQAKTKKHIKGDDKFNAKLGFILAKQQGLKTLSCSKAASSADECILSHAKEGVYVATLDKQLQQRVKKKGAKVISVRQGNRFQVE